MLRRDGQHKFIGLQIVVRKFVKHFILQRYIKKEVLNVFQCAAQHIGARILIKMNRTGMGTGVSKNWALIKDKLRGCM